MPTITFNLKALESLTGKKLSSKLLSEKVPFLGTPIEEMDSKEMMIEVPPNRPDLLSLPGFARAFASFLGVKKGLKKYVAKKSSYKVVIDDKVSKVRPFTVCAVVKGLSFTDEKIKEIIDMQEKLHVTYGRNRKKMALGIYPLEMIRFPIAYTAKKPEEIKFVPLDFDKKLDARQILSLHPTGQKYGHLLEDKKVFPVFLDSKNQVLSVPPIINSNNVGKISNKTRDVFIECSGFDFEYLSMALNMVVTALADMGGQIYETSLVYKNKKTKTPNLNPWSINVDPKYVEKILGKKLSHAQIKECLAKMGIGFESGKALIPCYRADILHQIDLVEDIAIAYGYENIEEVIPRIGCTGKENEFHIFRNHLRNILIGAGIMEIKNFVLSSKEVQNNRVNDNQKLVEVDTSFSEEYSVLRRHLLSGILEVLSRNKHREYPQNIFEIGKIFQAKKEIFEKERLAVAICSSDADFTRIKQILDRIIKEFGLKYETIERNKADYPSFTMGRVGTIIVNGTRVAHIGEVSPAVLENFDLEMPVAYLELNVEKLYYEVQK